MTKPHLLAALLAGLLPLLARAEPLETSMTLFDLDKEPSERLTGTGVSKDYFFPLPVRGIEANAITGTVRLTPSPLIGPNSLATIKVNDHPVATAVLSANMTELALHFTAPLDADPKNSTGDFFKLTVEAVLDIPENEDRCEALAAGSIWVEIDSSSEIQVAFDNTNPDWTSIARLPQSLRNNIVVQTPAEESAAQMDLALKVASWVAYVKPNAEITIAPPGADIPEDTDLFAIEPAEPMKESLSVEADGTTRTITLSASDSSQVEEIWESLLVLDRFRIPGSKWDQLLQEGEGFQTRRHKSIALESLSRSFTARNVGIGEMSRTLDFDLALFGDRPAEIELNLAGRCREVHREGAATFSVFLNDYLIFTDNIEPETTQFSYQVKLTPELLRGENRVVVSLDYSPSDEECRTPLFNFFWQVDPRSNLAYREFLDLPAPDSLLEASQQFFGRNRYAALLGSPDDLAAACLTAVWLQRVNPPAPLTPFLVDALPENGPAIAVGQSDELSATTNMRLPVAARDEALRFSSPQGDDIFQASSNTSIGLLQLAYRGPDRPVILADPWGSAGNTALEAMMEGVANEPWFGGGDLLLGDGEVPALAVVTDMLVEGEWQPPRQMEELAFSWKKWRWWFVGGVWLLVSAVVLWIFSKSRANATRG